MPYVGNKPEVGNFRKCDAITTSATATYNLLVGGVAVNPNQNQCIVSLNGVIQSSGNSYTIASSQITFASALTSSDVIDFILILGDTLNVGTVSDETISTAKIQANAVTYPKTSGLVRPNSKALIVNGDMAVAQRGTSFTSNGYTLDRWTMDESTDGAVTVTQDTDVPSGYGFANSLKIDCTTADGTIGADQYAAMVMFFEGQNLQLFKYGTSSAENLTLSFWVKAVKTGTYCIRFVKEAGSGTRYETPIEYTVSSASTWEKKVINLSPTAGSTSLITGAAGAIANNNSAGFRIGFTLAAGSNKQGTNNTWVAGSDKMGTSNQVNGLDSTSNNFWITGVQLEVGEYTSSTLPPFQHESYGENLQRCLRYFEKIADGSEDADAVISLGFVYQTNVISLAYKWSPKRTTPSIYQSSGTNYFRYQRDGGTEDFDSIKIYIPNYLNGLIYSDDAFTGADDENGWVQLNSSSAYLGLDAEL